MNSKPRNPSAFPKTKTAGNVSITDGGMTLRDYFAAKAMQGLVSDSQVDMAFCDMAKWSYSMADAMLAERECEQ
jgi:hypothetical protein